MAVRQKRPVNLKRLLEDYNRIAGTRAAFEAIARDKKLTPPSSDVLERIAREGEATPASLSRIAEILGTSATSYAVTALKTQTVPNLSGRWVAIYLETHPPEYNISRTFEHLTINQNGTIIRGYYDFWKNDDPQIYRKSVFSMRGHVSEKFITGFYFVRGRIESQGIGTFQLKLLRSDSWAEGYCTFCSDDDMVAMSHNIWVRDNHEDYAYHLDAAAKSILREADFFIRPRP